jgi:Ca2+-transporting ATPase
LVVAFLAVILVNRSWSRSAFSMFRTRNTALRWVLLGTTGLLAIVLFVPAAQGLLHFAPLHPTDLVLALGAGVVCVAWFELLKLVRRVRVASDGTTPAQTSAP